MRGFRSKFIVLLIVYFLGFATAIYTLVPVEDNEAAADSERTFAYSALKSNEFAQKFGVQLHRCVDFIKAKSCEAGEFIKQKIEERQSSS